jgi:hypothetical protein
MKLFLCIFVLCFFSLSCSQFSETKGSPQSNGDAENEAEQINKGDVVPDDAAETPQNQNNGTKPKVLSF